MEIEVNCVHRNTTDNDFISTCRLCGQEKQHFQDKPKRQPLVLKRGAIDGIRTRIQPLNTKDLEENQPAAEAVEEVPAPEPVSMPGLYGEEKGGRVLGAKEEPVPTSPKPANWKEMRLRQRKQWYDEHREAIIQDYLTMSKEEFFNKWLITSSTWRGLEKRWPELQKQPVTPATPQVSPVPAKKKRKSRKLHRNYLNNHKDEVIADYYKMPLMSFYDKWGLSATLWTEMKALWGVKGKRALRGEEPPEVASEVPAAIKEPPPPAPEEVKPALPWKNEPMNKRTGVRAVWKF